MDNLSVVTVLSMPNNKWSEDAMQLFNKLDKLPGYTRIADAFLSDGSRKFIQAVKEEGMFFEYAFFRNPSLQTAKGVVQFGVRTRGLGPLTIHSVVLLETSVDKIEGRKVFLSSTLKTVDGSETYATSTAIFVRAKKSSL